MTRRRLVLLLGTGALVSEALTGIAANLAQSSDPISVEVVRRHPWAWVVVLVTLTFWIAAFWLIGGLEGAAGLRLQEQELRANRKNTLANVRRDVSGRLNSSLVNLLFDNDPESVTGLRVRMAALSEGRELPPDADISAAFAAMDGYLLLLGRPGSGKTTQLLRLAESLAGKAERDASEPIPVVLELSSWRRGATKDRLPNENELDDRFATWLLRSMRDRYGTPIAAGQTWLQEGGLVLLLDGSRRPGGPADRRCLPYRRPPRRLAAPHHRRHA
jgi:hypothetical protein